jgi:hypothetical protein
MSRRDAIQISETELSALTADLEEMHRASLPALRRGVAMVTSRRGFLAGTGLVAGGLVLAACGSGSSSNASAGTDATTAPPANSAMETDLKVAALATGLENLAVQVYQAGIDAAKAGKLGAVPPAVVTFAQTAQMQHRDHAGAWNAILKSAGRPEVAGVDQTVKTAVTDPTLAKVTDVAGLAKLALALEDAAAATYLSALSILSSKGGIQTTASIQPVEMQHAAILNLLLGQYPVPDAFAKTAGARGPTDQIG